MFGSTPSWLSLTFVNKVFVFYFPNFYDNEWVCLVWEIPAVKYLPSSYLLRYKLRVVGMVKYTKVMYLTIVIRDSSGEFSCGCGLEISPKSVFVLLSINTTTRWGGGVL